MSMKPDQSSRLRIISPATPNAKKKTFPKSMDTLSSILPFVTKYLDFQCCINPRCASKGFFYNLNTTKLISKACEGVLGRKRLSNSSQLYESCLIMKKRIKHITPDPLRRSLIDNCVQRMEAATKRYECSSSTLPCAVDILIKLIDKLSNDKQSTQCCSSSLLIVSSNAFLLATVCLLIATKFCDVRALKIYQILGGSRDYRECDIIEAEETILHYLESDWVYPVQHSVYLQQVKSILSEDIKPIDLFPLTYATVFNLVESCGLRCFACPIPPLLKAAGISLVSLLLEQAYFGVAPKWKQFGTLATSLLYMLMAGDTLLHDCSDHDDKENHQYRRNVTPKEISYLDRSFEPFLAYFIANTICDYIQTELERFDRCKQMLCAVK